LRPPITCYSSQRTPFIPNRNELHTEFHWTRTKRVNEADGESHTDGAAKRSSRHGQEATTIRATYEWEHEQPLGVSQRSKVEIESGTKENAKSAEEVIFLRLPEVKAVTGLSKTTLYSLIREHSFPAPVSLGPRVVAWVKSEIKQWATDRILASRSRSLYAEQRKKSRLALTEPRTAPRKTA
jgi:prophage regulatory protein